MIETSTLDLAELERLEKAATPGPWSARKEETIFPLRGENRWRIGLLDFNERQDEDAEFITALRNAAPALIVAAKERDELRGLAYHPDGDTYRELWKLSRANVGRIAKRANELRADGEDVVQMLVERDAVADKALAELAVLRAQLQTACEALEPLVCRCEDVCCDDVRVIFKNCFFHRARAALAAIKKEPQP